jgi:hypothetical protein
MIEREGSALQKLESIEVAFFPQHFKISGEYITLPVIQVTTPGTKLHVKCVPINRMSWPGTYSRIPFSHGKSVTSAYAGTVVAGWLAALRYARIGNV